MSRLRSFIWALAMLPVVQTSIARAQPTGPGGTVSVDLEYKDRLAALEPGDVEGHYALAEWCRTQHRADLVVEQCRRVLELKPDHADARRLLDEARQELAGRTRGRPAETVETNESDDRRTDKLDLVSDEDIQRLRLAELNPDRPERVLVKFHDRAAVRFANRMVDQRKFTPRDRTAFLRARPFEQLFVMFQHDFQDFRDDIEIRSDPLVFASLRTRIWPTIETGCATSVCHGSIHAPAFRLLPGKAHSDRAFYTNFLILNSIRVDGRPLINRDRPEESLLLDYLLPRELAENHHSTEIDPVVMSKRDPRYQRIQQWITSLRRRPEYDIRWRPPGQKDDNVDQQTDRPVP